MQILVKKIRPLSRTDLVSGPSGETRTHGLLNPIQARYHLRYTRIPELFYHIFLKCQGFVRNNYKKYGFFLKGEEIAFSTNTFVPNGNNRKRGDFLND